MPNPDLRGIEINRNLQSFRRDIKAIVKIIDKLINRDLNDHQNNGKGRSMMKEVPRLLKLVADGLKSLAEGVEAIAEKIDETVKTKSTGKAEPDKQPAPEKTDKTVDIKPKIAQKVTPKVDRKKAVKPATATGTVLDIISRSSKGLSTAAIKAQTGYEQKKVSSIVYKLKKQGKVKAVQKGVYVKS